MAPPTWLDAHGRRRPTLACWTLTPRRGKPYAKGAANGPHAAALITRRRPQADTARGEPRGGGFSRRARVDPFRAPPDLGNAGAARPGRILHSRLGHRALPV